MLLFLVTLFMLLEQSPSEYRMYTFGGIFGEKARTRLAEYQAFRRENPHLRREELSRRWALYKALTQAQSSRRQRVRPPVIMPTEEETEQILEEYIKDLQEQDPKYLLSELLRVSQSNPSCFPFGLSPEQLRDPNLLRQALYRARGKVF